MKSVELLSCVLGLSFLLAGCAKEDASVKVAKNIGYFVSTLKGSVEYVCENERQVMKDNGKFECTSFPITFYMDDMKLGQISTIHSDGFVYPQDIIILEDYAPIYTSEGSIEFLTIE